MEAFSGLMESMTKRTQFCFHWRCHKVKILYHDDVLILYKGHELYSVSVVNECLNQFRDM
jgi:hypothetical protein